MRLSKVEYEFFDFEEPSATAVDLARQIRLHFVDAPRMFLSWTWERQYDSTCEPFAIGRSADSFFLGEPDALLDASNSPEWARHLGQEVDVRYWPSTSPTFENQVIEVRSGGESTFVFSLGRDRVGISTFPVDTTAAVKKWMRGLPRDADKRGLG